MALKWLYRPASRAPQKIIVIALGGLMGATAGTIIYGPWVGLVGFAIVVGATSEFWLGVQCDINETGVSTRVGLSFTQMPWSEVKSVIVSERSIRCSPHIVQTRLSEFRGVDLRFFPEERESILDVIRLYCEEDVRFHGPAALGGGDGSSDS